MRGNDAWKMDSHCCRGETRSMCGLCHVARYQLKKGDELQRGSDEAKHHTGFFLLREALELVGWIPRSNKIGRLHLLESLCSFSLQVDVLCTSKTMSN